MFVEPYKYSLDLLGKPGGEFGVFCSKKFSVFAPDSKSLNSKVRLVSSGLLEAGVSVCQSWSTAFVLTVVETLSVVVTDAMETWYCK